MMVNWQVFYEYNKEITRAAFDVIWRQIAEEDAFKVNEQMRWADDGGPLPNVDHADSWEHLYAL